VTDSIAKRIARAVGLGKDRTPQPLPEIGVFAPPKAKPRAVRMYGAAKASRLTADWGQTTTSADSELSTSFAALRNRSRQLVRDASYAKRAKRIVQANVIGAGIGIQAQVESSRGNPRRDVNEQIEEAHAEWSRSINCHTGGVLALPDIERLGIGHVFEAGEILIREHFRPFGTSRIPYALEVIESERLIPDMNAPTLNAAPGNVVKMGVEVNTYGRPVAYWIRTNHPGDYRVPVEARQKVERVPASEVYHLKLTDRWPQTRGEPWLHAVARRLNDMDGYSEAEITAARGAASYMATIETDSTDPEAYGEETEKASGDFEVELAPAQVLRLQPGERFNPFAPNRPNANMDPFMRMMLREVAAGVDVSYESLSRDYSQSNYSSSRLSLIDDRDLWRILQQWWIREFRVPVYRNWLTQAVLSGEIPSISIQEFAANQKKFWAIRFKPRGWSWIDPTKEVDAAEKAVRAGFTTVTDVIAETGAGRDIEDVIKTRARELELFEEADIDTTTYVEQPPEVPEPGETTDTGGSTDPVETDEPTQTGRVVSIGR
jgi:lambda family phage portal protein